MTARWITADVFDGLATLEDGSVDLVICSPPFLALRSYLPADHLDKSKEIGSEPTPAAFIDVMLAVTAELRRVLAPHGSIAIELGDTYAGSSEAGWHRAPDMAKPQRAQASADGWLDGSPRKGDGWPLAKSKTLIPELYRLALAYGINPLTGTESPAGQWRVRNVVTWCRPNPPVGALGDKWRPATSDIVVACVSGKRYWDDIATRRPGVTENGRARGPKTGGAFEDHRDTLGEYVANTAGAPLLDYWELPPGGYPGSHYAVYPPALVEPLVKAMAPPKVCRTCGEPSRRIVEADRQAQWDKPTRPSDVAAFKMGGPWSGGTVETNYSTVGWSDCSHDNNWRPAHILDPFAGSGTTLAVATGHGHDATGIDLDPRNADLARDRIGPLLFDEVGL